MKRRYQDPDPLHGNGKAVPVPTRYVGGYRWRQRDGLTRGNKAARQRQATGFAAKGSAPRLSDTFLLRAQMMLHRLFF